MVSVGSIDIGATAVRMLLSTLVSGVVHVAASVVFVCEVLL